MFLNAPLRRKTAALSGLSDERTDEVVREEFSRVNSRRGKICCKKYLNFFVIPFQNRHLHRTPDGWDRAGKSPGAKRKGSGGQCASKWIKSGGRKVVCWIFEGDGNEFH